MHGYVAVQLVSNNDKGDARNGDEQKSARVGLCASCRHVEPVTTARGMTFYLCRRSLTDPTFSKYPTLPVRTCAGYDSDSVERGA